MNLYPRLKDLREDKEKNQSEIALILGTTQRQYSRWENGTPPIDVIKQLAIYYDVSADYIIGLTNNKKKFW